MMHKGVFPFRQTWWSVCSMHHPKDPNTPYATCNMCMAGHWSYDILVKISQMVYKIAPRFWRWYVKL